MTDWVRCGSCRMWVDGSETLCVNCMATLPRDADTPLDPLARDFAVIDMLKRKRNDRIQTMLGLSWMAVMLIVPLSFLYDPLENAHLLEHSAGIRPYVDIVYYFWSLAMLEFSVLILQKGGWTPHGYTPMAGLFCWGRPEWYKNAANIIAYCGFVALLLLGWMRPVLIHRIDHPVEPLYPPMHAHSYAQLVALIDRTLFVYAALALLAVVLVAISWCFNPVVNPPRSSPPRRDWVRQHGPESIPPESEPYDSLRSAASYSIRSSIGMVLLAIMGVAVLIGSLRGL